MATNRDNSKCLKVYMQTDTLAWQDLLEYGHELGMQPAETMRVIVAEWSRALRGRNAFGGAMMPQFSLPQASVPPSAETTKPKETEEHSRAKARGARFANALELDD